MRHRIMILLICVVVLILSIACIVDPVDPPGGWKPTQGSPIDAIRATETYGAEQWHAQLTALAETPEP